LHPKNCLPYLSVGRLVYVKSPTEDWGFGIVINFLRKHRGRRGK